MNIKTITSTEGVNEVDFGSSASRFYWFHNIGTTTVYVSANANIVAGADGVAELAAGGVTCTETTEGKVYVLGAGVVQIHNTGDKFCPVFKRAPAQSGGGSGTGDGYTKSESDARYAQKSEIPTELPANGGNSDTVGGHTVMTDVPENAVFTDTVIKSTVVSGTTDANSNLAVFPAADNKILIIGFYYNCICIPIVRSDGLLCMHMTAIDGTNMANTTIPSMEVFYFER